jgi:hypothetical protein
MNIQVKEASLLGQPWTGEVLDSSSFKILKRMLLYKLGNIKSITSSTWLTLVTFSTMRRPSTNEAETLRSVTTYQSWVSAPNLEKPSASPCEVKPQYELENRSRGLYVLTCSFYLPSCTVLCLLCIKCIHDESVAYAHFMFEVTHRVSSKYNITRNYNNNCWANFILVRICHTHETWVEINYILQNKLP